MNARSEHEASYHHTAEFAERVRLNQRELAANLKPPQYDFIVPLGKTAEGSRRASMLLLQTLKQSEIKQWHQEPYGHRLARARSACRVVRHSGIWWIRSRLPRR